MGIIFSAFAIGILAAVSSAPRRRRLRWGWMAGLARRAVCRVVLHGHSRPDRRSGVLVLAMAAIGDRLGLRGLAGRAAPRRGPARRVGGRDVVVTGVVASLPQDFERACASSSRWRRVRAGAKDLAGLVQGFSRRGDAHAAAPHAGERWRLTVRLKRPAAMEPPRFRLRALAAGTGYPGHRLRAPAPDNHRLDAFVPGHVRGRAPARGRAERFRRALPDAYAGVLVALAVGDQRSIPPGCGGSLRGQASPTWWRSAGCT